ncbi:MAG: Ig-like domain-containing protein, partial [Chloroflexi bacterium]|nr:Ig-like domain-containing protein [Chloroflexota bacterium]
MTHISPRWSRVTFTVLIAISLLVASLTGCADTPTPTPPPPTATRTATATIIPPTDTPEPTATATSTPLPPHAPFITYRFPAPGEELRTDAPIAITFDQPMDQASVEAAFQIQPVVKGELKWQDNTLTFKPTGESFLRNATYTVSINERAKSLMGLPIQAPAAFRLRTVGYLEATDVQPADDTVEVDMKAAVTVSFNRPVVPLTSIGSQA